MVVSTRRGRTSTSSAGGGDSKRNSVGGGRSTSRGRRRTLEENDDDDDDDDLEQENRQPNGGDMASTALVLSNQQQPYNSPGGFQPPFYQQQQYQQQQQNQQQQYQQQQHQQQYQQQQHQQQHPHHQAFPSEQEPHFSVFVNVTGVILVTATGVGLYLLLHSLGQTVGQSLSLYMSNRLDDLRAGYSALRNGTITFSCSVGGPTIQQLECEVGSLANRALYAFVTQVYELFSILFKSTNLLHTLAILGGVWTFLRQTCGAIIPVLASFCSFCWRGVHYYHLLLCRALDKHLS